MAPSAESKLLVWSAAASVAAVAGGYMVYRAVSGPQPHPALKTLKGLPAFPFFLKPLFMLPPSILKHILPPMPDYIPDRTDAYGESSHTMTMNDSDGVLAVEYEYSMDTAMFGFLSGMFTEKKKEEILNGSADIDEKEQLQRDFEVMDCCKKITPKDGQKGEYLKNGFAMTSTMAAIKMSGGRVLLYNPVKITPEVMARIEQLGEVRWIVTGSCAHTLFARSAMDAFPGAKFVGPYGANIKIAKTGVRADYDYTQQSHLTELQKELGADFDLLYIPDPMAHNLILKKKDVGVIFEVDLLYNFNTTEAKKRLPTRLMLATAFRDSPNKVLPVYRFPPLLGGFFPTVPQPELDCREKTTAAIKELLYEWTYKKAFSGHGPAVTADTFCAMIEKAWLEWLVDPDTLMHA